MMMNKLLIKDVFTIDIVTYLDEFHVFFFLCVQHSWLRTMSGRSRKNSFEVYALSSGMGKSSDMKIPYTHCKCSWLSTYKHRNALLN